MRIRQSDDPATHVQIALDLSYDYIMVKGACSNFATCHHRYGRRTAVGGHRAGSRVLASPSLITQSIWLMATNCLESTSMALSLCLAITAVSELSISTITSIRGKVGIILDADTTTHYESARSEVDASGRRFEDVEHGRHHQRSHDRRRRRSEPVCLSRRRPTGSITTVSPTTGRTTP